MSFEISGINEIQIIPRAANIFKIRVGTLELEVYCSDEYVAIKSKGKIEYPEILVGKHLAKDSVKFYPPKDSTEENSKEPETDGRKFRGGLIK